jgi:hypothetical protein
MFFFFEYTRFGKIHERSPQTGAAGIHWGGIIANGTYDKIIESRDADPALFTKEEKKEVAL